MAVEMTNLHKRMLSQTYGSNLCLSEYKADAHPTKLLGPAKPLLDLQIQRKSKNSLNLDTNYKNIKRANFLIKEAFLST